MKLFLSALGLMLIFEGLPYFAFPERIKRWLRTVMGLPASQLRMLGFFSITDEKQDEAGKYIFTGIMNTPCNVRLIVCSA